MKQEVDIVDMIAGELKVSRGTAYELMREALEVNNKGVNALAEQQASQESTVTFGEVERTMQALRTGTLEQKQVYDVMKDKPLYTSPPVPSSAQHAAEPVAWGLGNTAITGSNRWMMLREQVPADDQYGGAMWTPLYTHPAPTQQPVLVRDLAEIKWPSARDVGRYGDMSPHAHLRIGLDSDNDVYVHVWGDDGGAAVEFCTGGGGGGSSPATRAALIALMSAMEADNAARPDKDWWARRNGITGSKT